MEKSARKFDFKTPRSLITEYLESSKTESVKRAGNRDRIVRTPETDRQLLETTRSPALVAAHITRSSTERSKPVTPGRRQSPEEARRSPSFFAVQKPRKSSMVDYKTPRTLITQYQEGTKTQTTKPVRQRDKFMRSPDVTSRSPARSQPVMSPARGGRSPGRYVQHDRVSSLRGKRTRSLTNLTDENTPRTLIEGFLAGEDTTAPAVRHLRRTSQSTYSASQPVGSSAKRQTLVHMSMNEQDTETPRTLIQNYLRNATNVIETPVVSIGQQSPDVSLTVPVVTEPQEYHTPSPFKASSQGSDASNITRSARRSSARKRTGSYHIPVQVQEQEPKDWESSSLSDVIYPTSPASASYQVPSAFLSSPESTTDMTVTQSQKDRLNWVPRKTLNISLPREVVKDTYQSSPRSDQSQGRDNSSLYEEEAIPETQTERRTSHQEPHIIYSLPLKTGADSLNDDGDDDDGDTESGNTGYRYGGFAADEIEAEKENTGIDVDRMSNKSFENSHDSSRSSVIIYNDDITVDRGRMRQDTESGRLSDGVLIRKRKRDSGTEDFDAELDDRFERHVAKHGRWSEGHQLREKIQVDHRHGRYSEGHLVQKHDHLVQSTGERSYDFSKSPRHISAHILKGQSSENYRSDNFLDATPSIRRSPPSRDVDTNAEMRPTPRNIGMGDGQRENSYSESRGMRQHISGHESIIGQGHIEAGQDISDNGMEDRISPLGAGHVHALPENTANFSPTVASTQRVNFPPYHSPSLRTVHGSKQAQAMSDISRFSPKISSTQKAQSFNDGSTTVIGRRRQGQVEDLPDNTGNFSPKISSTQRLQSVTGNMADVSPLDHASPSPVVSPEKESLVSTGTPGSGSRRKKRSTTSDGFEQSSPLDTVTPSPVVSPQRDSMSPSRTPGSSTQKTRTPESSASRRKTPDSQRSVSVRSSKLKKGLITVSSGSVGHRRSSEMGDRTSSQTEPVGSMSRFSPRISSTRREQKMSEENIGVTQTRASQNQTMTDNTVVATASTSVPSTSQEQGAATEARVQTKKPRGPRKKSQYGIPVSLVKKDFTRFAGMRVSKEAIEEVMKVSEVYWDNLAADLEAYAKHAGRKKINMDDFVLLFRRHRLINEKQSLYSLIERYLPMEERQALIPVARAYNRIDPSFKG